MRPLINPPGFSPFRIGQAPGVCFVLALCLSAGCGRRDYEIVPVSGRVTLDGQPLADVGITFVPLAEDKQNPNVGPGSLGKTDAAGRFTLQTADGEKGAVPAEHIVRMSMAVQPAGSIDGDELAAPSRSGGKSPLPKSAADGTLHYVVPPDGTTEANFDLTGGSKAGTR